MLMSRVEEACATLRPSERRVAAYVRARPHVAASLTIADLAASAGVSEPTVMRFCRAVGCVGYQDFKRGLLRDLERRSPMGSGARETRNGGDSLRALAVALARAGAVAVRGPDTLGDLPALLEADLGGAGAGSGPRAMVWLDTADGQLTARIDDHPALPFPGTWDSLAGRAAALEGLARLPALVREEASRRQAAPPAATGRGHRSGGAQARPGVEETHA